MAEFTAYAPPLVYGTWQVIGSHLGTVNYTVKYSPIGDSNAFAKVKFFNDKEEEVEKEFFEQITFTTGNVVANVSVQFKAPGPAGVTVQGEITP